MKKYLFRTNGRLIEVYADSYFNAKDLLKFVVGDTLINPELIKTTDMNHMKVN